MVLPTLTLPIKILCRVVYFNFCSKLNISLMKTELYTNPNKQNKDEQAVPLKAEVQVTPVAVYFTVEMCFVLTCM